MEANLCEVNQLNSDLLLPPRKRLLAGLKKQNSEIDSNWQALCISSPSSATSGVFGARLNSLLNSNSDKSSLSPEEIVETSSLAAAAAANAAKLARSLAEEKAAIAAKAVAAAKSALDLVGSFPQESGINDGYLKRNKQKKHVPMISLYGKRKSVENCRADEELARGSIVPRGNSRILNVDEVDSPKCNGIADSGEEKSFEHINNGRLKGDGTASRVILMRSFGAKEVPARGRMTRTR